MDKQKPPSGGRGVSSTCDHKFVHLDTSKFTESESYNFRFVRIDRFFCEHCLEDRTKVRTECSRDTPEWYL